MRPTWDEIWMQMAFVIAQRSLCSRAQVGAVIVTPDNRVQAAAYNGPPPRFPHQGKPCVEWCARAMSPKVAKADPAYQDCWATHAETNAVLRADWSQLEGATLYVNGAMCINCAKFLCQTKISRVVQVVRLAESYRRPDDVEDFLRAMGIEVQRYDDAESG